MVTLSLPRALIKIKGVTWVIEISNKWPLAAIIFDKAFDYFRDFISSKIFGAKALQPEQQSNKNIISYSDALEKTGFGIFNYSLIFISGLVLANVVLETASIGFILPIAECDLKLSNKDKGVLSAVGYVGIIISSHLWGFLADTKGRRAVIMPTLLMSFTVTLISSFSHRFWLLAFLRFVNGIFVSGASATVYAYVGEFHIDRTRSRAMMGSSFVFAIAGMMLPVIAWGVINQSWSLPMSLLGIVYKPWRLFIAVCGSSGLVSGLALLLYPESPKFLLSVGKEKEAIGILKQMHKWNVGRGELKIDGVIPENDITVRNLNEHSSKSTNFARRFLRTMWEQTFPLLQRNFLRTTVIVCTIQFWLYVTIHGMFMWFPYITDSMVEFMHHNPGNKSLICDVVYAKQAEVYKLDGKMHCTERLEVSTYIYSLVMQILFAVGYAVIGVIVNKVRKVYILFVLLVGFGACGVIAIHISYPWVALCAYVLLFISGLGIQLLGGTTAELYPTYLRGMALCISLMFGRLGGVFGANIVGLLLSDNCEITFYISGIALIFCGFLAFLIPKELKVKDDVTIDMRTKELAIVD